MAQQRNTASKKTSHSRVGISGRGMLYVMLALAIILIVFMIAVYPLVMIGAPDNAWIMIPRNATEKTVSDSLSKHLGPDYTSKVMRLVKIRHTDFDKRHGAYRIEKGTNALSAMRRLTSGAQSPIKITINGYRSVHRLIDKVALKFDFDADSLRNALYDPGFLDTYGLTQDQAIALFVDDSYEAYWSDTPKHVLEIFGKNYNKLWNPDNTKKAKELGLTPAGMMTVASIVDEETNNEGEKGTIGQLYINRLRKGMRLQADPTVRYAVGDFTIRRVHGANLHFDSPYNTYIHKGLPPGPIRTTSSKTVKLILDSPANEYLFMCAKEDFSGTHNFAVDYGEHTRNALRYQHALNERGIK